MAVSLMACSGSASSGPQAWIDQPLDGSNLPVDTAITIQAHASDDDGVARFEFSVDDQVLNTVNAAGTRLGNAAIEWTPPGAGPYLIKVRAFDGQGNPGSYAIKEVNVLGMQTLAGLPTQVQPTPKLIDPSIPELLASDTSAHIVKVECGQGGLVLVEVVVTHPLGIRAITVFSTWGDALVQEKFAGLSSNPTTSVGGIYQLIEPTDSIDRDHQIGLKAEFVGTEAPAFDYALEPDGRCTGHYEPQLADDGLKLPWITAKQNSNCRAGTGSQFEILGFLLADQSATIEARDALNDWVVITAPDMGKACWIAASLGDIEGELGEVAIIATPVPPLPTATTEGAPPDPNQPPTDPNNPPPAGLDTTPPVIQSANVSPASILTPGGGCSSDPRTATVTVVATDPGGIAHATVFWNLAGDSGQAALTFVGGDTWQGEAGPVNKTGTLNLFVNVEDNAGNDVLSGVLTVQVQSCIN